MRRIGVLMSNAADDPIGQVWTKAFTEGLQQLGWEVGRNVRIDYRWGASDTDRFRGYASWVHVNVTFVCRHSGIPPFLHIVHLATPSHVAKQKPRNE